MNKRQKIKELKELFKEQIEYGLVKVEDWRIVIYLERLEYIENGLDKLVETLKLIKTVPYLEKYYSSYYEIGYYNQIDNIYIFFTIK